MPASRKTYPANLQLVYRGVKYRPAALQLFVERGGWGPQPKPEDRDSWRVTN